MKKFLIFLILALVTAGCTQKDSGLQRYSNSTIEAGFDTEMTMIAFTEDEAAFNNYFERMKEEFLRYHRLFDRFNSYEGISNIKTINDNAGIAPVSVDPFIIELLEDAKRYTEVSDYFDITYGAVYDIWHDYREAGTILNAEGKDGEIPSMDLLEEAQQYTGWDYIEIDSIRNTVYLTRENVMLDVGAIAKGFATEKVAQTLEAEGLEYAVVSGGGNIRTINTRADGSPWEIGVQMPSLGLGGSSIDVFSIPYSISIVTSGDYQRYYYAADDKRISHLINPKTLMPEEQYRSVTVFTKNSTMADAFSTAIFMMGYEEAQAFIEQFNAENPDDRIDVLWVKDAQDGWYTYEDFSYMMSDYLNQYSRNLKEQ